VEIVEDEENGCLGGGSGQPGHHRIEEPVALGLGVGLEWRSKAGHQRGQLGQQPGQFPGVTAEAGWADMVHVELQRLYEGLVGDTEVLVATTGEDQGPVVMNARGELGSQAGLTDPRLTAQQDHLRLAGQHLFPQLPQPFQLRVPAHEDAARSSEQGRHREPRRRGGGRRPRRLAYRQRPGKALQLHRAERGELHRGSGAGHHRHHGGTEDLAGPRRPHQAGRLHHRCAEDVAVLIRHLTDGQADPQLEMEVRLPTLSIGGLLENHGRGQGIHGGAKGGQDPVTRRLQHSAVMGFDGPS
jgi:hypothetical protein